jgi:hypothetical protein
MKTTETVPYLKRLNTNEGTGQNPNLLYVTHGGKKKSYIFHYKEENLYYQYRVYILNYYTFKELLMIFLPMAYQSN